MNKHPPLFPQARRTTSHEVAKAAGVSQATVSNVLNRPELVAPATRERVTSAIDRLGFVVNDGARRLRVGWSSVLAVSVLDVSNPFWGEVTRGVADYAAEHGFVIALGSTGESIARENDNLRLFEEQRVAAVLAAPVDSSLVRLRRLGRTGITVVLLDAKDPAERLSYVSVDDVQGGILVGRYLLDLGHRLIACVNGPHVRAWSEDRWNGMRRAVEERGLDPDRVLVRAPVETLVAAEGERAADQLFASRQDVTAIFCDNDLLALGALHALRRRGMAVPGDVSVVGYDDDDFAAMISPSLSTVRQEPYKLGRCAAEVAVNAVAGRPALDRPSGQAFAPSLITRGSTARPRQGSMRAQAG